jgi:hypothetical protein
MKVNVKGLVFVGFAAAILSGAAKADDTQIVTSKAFTEATYQKKIGGTAGQLPVTTATAGNVEYTTIETNKTGITTGATTIPTAGAVADKIADANSNANGRQTASTADFQVGATGGAWKQIVTDSYTDLTVDGTDTSKVNLTVAVTTDGTLADAVNSTGSNSADYNKLTTGHAVKAYADSKVASAVTDGDTTHAPSGQAVSTALAGKQGNLGGTANQIPVTTADAGVVTYKNIATASSGIATGEVTIPTSGAVADAISGAVNGANLSQYEVHSNKVTSLSASSTDAQYPSAKLTYDQLALKQDKQLGAAKINDADSTDKGKLVVINASGQIDKDTAHITSSVTSGSNDVVTSNAVYTYVTGLPASTIPNGSNCSPEAPCALVATGSNTFAWVPMSQPSNN